MVATRTVLITGASSGIGLELAKLFAKDNYELVLVARNEQRLTDIAAGLDATVHVIPLDLAEEQAADSLWQQINDKQLQIDVLVNNAGVGLFGLFHETDINKEHSMMNLNMIALTELTKKALPPMLERGRGKILNIASTAAFQPGPLMAIYYASKAYVLSFSEALAEETRGSGVTVTVLCPGPTTTGFVEQANLGGSALFNEQKPMEASKVATIGYRALQQGKVIAIPGLRNTLLVWLTRFTPRALVRRIVHYVQRPL